MPFFNPKKAVFITKLREAAASPAGETGHGLCVTPMATERPQKGHLCPKFLPYLHGAVPGAAPRAFLLGPWGSAQALGLCPPSQNPALPSAGSTCVCAHRGKWLLMGPRHISCFTGDEHSPGTELLPAPFPPGTTKPCRKNQLCPGFPKKTPKNPGDVLDPKDWGCPPHAQS